MSLKSIDCPKKNYFADFNLNQETSENKWIDQNNKKFLSIQDFNVYFVKTHKTASSALQNVLIRLADKRNMRVVNDLNKESLLAQNKRLNNKIYFFHGRHDVKMAAKAFPRNHTLYMTILRNPADQLLSSIYYFSSLKDQKKNIFQNIQNESAMKSLGKKNRVFCLLKNSASYDLGYVGCAESYTHSEKSLIELFKEEFDLVILTEDIVCLSVNQGTKRSEPKDRQWAESVISRVSNADLILYNYYLEKYKILSKLLKNELQNLKRLNELYQNKCTDGRQKKFFYANVPYIGYALKTNLTAGYKDYCWKLTSTELEMIDYITKKSKNKVSFGFDFLHLDYLRFVRHQNNTQKKMF
ncbi:Galactosylceramide sulfotransferase [Brachionus plicatilis]|uniref:Galactosylceramide sulfotransferase n=1 Tax=Brachionus plicatilis TaxID=10195 RepID=A0A3M7Q3N7_BRAPC|nr:Galactosylceramide sulfotransferase [Brachionus plicatilis]